jgi:hypothetical protein
MKKIILGIIVCMLFITTAIFPLADAINTNTTSKKENTYGRNVNTTNLTLTITGGKGVAVNTKNIGELNATNVITNATITGGFFGNIKLSGGVVKTFLAHNVVVTFHILPLGLGPITINATTHANNAAPVTKTAKGFILLFYVIIK